MLELFQNVHIVNWVIDVDVPWIRELLQRILEQMRPSNVPAVGSRHYTQVHVDG